MKHAFIKGFLSSWTVNNRFLNFDQIKISDEVPRLFFTSYLKGFNGYLLSEQET
mgnify:CR=1 FL=1